MTNRDVMLSDYELGILLRVLANFSERIETVRLFGSRATGVARENSDIDLVIQGALSEADVDRLWTLFDESGLPTAVDIVLLTSATPPKLRDQIESTARPLFSRSELLEARRAPSSRRTLQSPSSP